MQRARRAVVEMKQDPKALDHAKPSQRVNSRTTPRKKIPNGTDQRLYGSPIEDYAVIGDCETAALVSRGGSIDWLCWPTFSSGACFAALLGTRDHGFWKLAPKQAVKSKRRNYVEGTLIMETFFVTAGGEVCVTDFMPPRGKHSQLVRTVRCERGSVAMSTEIAIRFDYGRTVPWVTSTDQGGGCELHAIAGPDMVILRSEVALKGRDHTTVGEFTVRAGETVSFNLTYCSSLVDKAPPSASPATLTATTKNFWKKWLSKSKYRGEYRAAVERSLLTLKVLAYRPTGGIVAAVTTSLPEKIGSERNWDYRFCWLRDTAFTLLVLLHAGFQEEAVAWRRWLLRAVAGAPEQVQTIYGIRGERDLVEWEASWLPGYEHSAPVRIGNGAVSQFQLDVFGEVAAALARMPEAEDDIRMPAWDVQAALADHLCGIWTEPDEGIWEVRGGPKHFVHSKVMAWVALDRTIRMFEAGPGKHEAGRRRGAKKEVQRWRAVREQIHAEVCKKGFDPALNSFVQAYGPGAKPGALDASCLRIGLVGFLPMTDPRIVGTVDAIQSRLMKDGFVQRYRTEDGQDGLKGGEGQFLACSFWLVTALWLIDRKADAKELFARLLGLCNDVGLLSEEYDSDAGRLLGNFPQALSHIALLHAAFTIDDGWTPAQPGGAHPGKRRLGRAGATKGSKPRS